MKKIILYTIALFSLLACAESELINEIKVSDLYVIQDNPNDPVQHRRYEIYKTYGVSTFFNDTIGQTFVRNDINNSSFASC